jgi:hypothetical protein
LYFLGEEIDALGEVVDDESVLRSVILKEEFSEIGVKFVNVSLVEGRAFFSQVDYQLLDPLLLR